MKRTFDFGCIDFENRGKAKNRVTVEMEYKQDGDKKVFSVSADVWNTRHSDIVCGGQCLDTIAPYINNPVFSEILRLWKLYHLNDLHPECEHQHAAGWDKLASKKVTLHHWRMTREAMSKQDKAKKPPCLLLQPGKHSHQQQNKPFLLGCLILLQHGQKHRRKNWRNITNRKSRFMLETVDTLKQRL